MSWIENNRFSKKPKGDSKQIYHRIAGPDGYIDNIMLVHSLRPHSLTGHMVLYKNVLHHRDNLVPRWFLETIGVYVSKLNGCDYCYAHHLAGLTQLIEKDHLERIQDAINHDRWADPVFEKKYQMALRYTRILTIDVAHVSETNVEDMRQAGLSDGEILEINQVASYFAYANRTVMGLGGTISEDILGMSPSNSEDPENWQHQ